MNTGLWIAGLAAVVTCGQLVLKYVELRTSTQSPASKTLQTMEQRVWKFIRNRGPALCLFVSSAVNLYHLTVSHAPITRVTLLASTLCGVALGFGALSWLAADIFSLFRRALDLHRDTVTILAALTKVSAAKSPRLNR